MKIIIVGCGRTGAELAQDLSTRGHAVTVVDSDPTAFERLGSKFKGQTIVGVGFDREVLLRASIERADGLAAVSASDETNVVVARIAKAIFRVPKVVARVNEPRKAEIYRRLDLQTLSPVTLGVHRLAELLTFSQLDTIAPLGSGEVEIAEAEVPALLIGRTVNELTIPSEVEVVAISRGGKTFLPTLGTLLQKDDRLHLAVLVSSTDRLRRLLGID